MLIQIRHKPILSFPVRLQFLYLLFKHSIRHFSPAPSYLASSQTHNHIEVGFFSFTPFAHSRTPFDIGGWQFAYTRKSWDIQNFTTKIQFIFCFPVHTHIFITFGVSYNGVSSFSLFIQGYLCFAFFFFLLFLSHFLSFFRNSVYRWSYLSCWILDRELPRRRRLFLETGTR